MDQTIVRLNPVPAQQPAVEPVPAEAAVRRYWRALGVTEERHLADLSRRVMERLEPADPEDLPERAIRRAQSLLDDWLAAVLPGLDLDTGPTALAAARVALLAAVPDWPARLLAGETMELTRRLQPALPRPMPPLAEKPMTVQVIELRALGLGGLIRRLLRPGRTG